MSLIKNALSSFKNIHFQSLLGNGVMAIVNMVVISILFRSLTIYDLGVYSFFMVLYNLIDTLKAGFLTNAFITFYTGTTRERANEIAGSSWTLALLISVGLIVINIPTYFIALHIDNYGTALYLKYFSIVAISTLPTFMANLIVQAEKRFDRLFWLRLINQVLFLGSIIVLTFLKNANITSILWAFTITNFVTSFIIMLFGWTNLHTLKHSTKHAINEIFNFGKYSVGTSISTNLFRVTDTFFVNFYLGAPAMAIYTLGGRWMQIVEIPILSFATSGMPILAGHYNSGHKDDMIKSMKKLIGMLSVGIFVLAILAIIFANPLIMLIGGHQYEGSMAPNLFRIFISIAVLFPADRFFAMTLDVIKKPKINFYKILIMLAANLIADFIGISLFKSVYSIVITNIVPVVIAIIIAYIPLQKYYKFSFWNIYVVGYHELILLIKHLYKSLLHKEAPLKS